VQITGPPAARSVDSGREGRGRPERGVGLVGRPAMVTTANAIVRFFRNDSFRVAEVIPQRTRNGSKPQPATGDGSFQPPDPDSKNRRGLGAWAANGQGDPKSVDRTSSGPGLVNEFRFSSLLDG